MYYVAQLFDPNLNYKHYSQHEDLDNPAKHYLHTITAQYGNEKLSYYPDYYESKDVLIKDINRYKQNTDQPNIFFIIIELH